MTRRFQFSLRALLVVMLALAVSVAWFAQRRDRIVQEVAVSRILSKGGVIGSDSQGNVGQISFAGQRGDVDLAANLINDDLRVLHIFGALQELDLSGRPITDAAVPYLSRIATLRLLNVTGTRISDNGLAQLRKALPECAIAE